MTTLTRNSEPFIYHNPYENSFQTDFQNSIVPLKDPVSDMSIERDNAIANDPALQNFTATGRPIPHPKDSRQGRAWQAYASADSLGQGPANFGPVRFTDDSVISIAVMPPEGVEAKTVDDDSDEDDGPIKAEPKKKFGFFRRKSSAYAKKKDKPFVMKQVTRADYLKYYAKDDDGNYTGTMDPAPDCILNNEKDRFKVRKAFASREAKTTGFMNSMVMM